uniref:Ankyrin repeat domain 27 n=1 Tax=Rattus norvegicus TaxID=10116 RepID=A0A8I6APD4_RAT
MALYDEDLLRNPFYLALQKWRPDLCSKVAQIHGIVLVPCRGSLPSNVQASCQFESYVLVPMEGHFQTLDGKPRESSAYRLGGPWYTPSQVCIPLRY